MRVYSFARHVLNALFISSLTHSTLGAFKFTNLQCECYAKSYGYFSECKMKAISRTTNSINIEFVLNKTFKEINAQFQILKRANGWRPFLYNMTSDPCQLVKNPTMFSLPGIIYNYVKPYTSFNHTCPYNAGEHIRLKSFQLDADDILKKFPIDVGDYALHSKWYVGNNLIVGLKISAAYTDYKKV